MGVYYGMNGLWVPVGGQGGTASVDPNLLAENIKSGVTISGVTGTFTNDAIATASDIASGATAYVNGAKVTGNVAVTTNGVKYMASSIEKNVSYLDTKYAIRADRLFRNGSTITLRSSLSNFGDATAADVASGKTFTSSAGLKITGTAKLEYIEQATVTVTNNHNYINDMFVSWINNDGTTGEARIAYGKSVSFETKKVFVISDTDTGTLWSADGCEVISVMNRTSGYKSYAITPTFPIVSFTLT